MGQFPSFTFTNSFKNLVLCFASSLPFSLLLTHICSCYFHLRQPRVVRYSLSHAVIALICSHVDAVSIHLPSFRYQVCTKCCSSTATLQLLSALVMFTPRWLVTNSQVFLRLYSFSKTQVNNFAYLIGLYLFSWVDSLLIMLNVHTIWA